MKKQTIAVISGWFGMGETNEYRHAPDNLSSHLLALFSALEEKYDVIYSRKLIKKRKDFLFELHLNYQFGLTSSPKICIELEDECNRPLNKLIKYSKYVLIFSTNRGLYKSYPNFVWYRYPRDFLSKKKFPKIRNCKFIMIASNRNIYIHKKRSMYNKRHELISFFEKNYPNDLCLFGKGWNNVFVKANVISILLKFFRQKFNLNKKVALQSWKGLLEKKGDVMASYDFSICLENVYDIDGYVSEKIYDSMFYGCIPIYIPSSHKNLDLIPDNLFINPNEFESLDEMVIYCKSLSEEDKNLWRSRMDDFLVKNRKKLSSKEFTNRIMNAINGALL